MATKNKTLSISPDRQWEIEDAMRILQRADTIRKDSKLMGEVTKSINNLQKMCVGGPVKATNPKKTLNRKKIK